MKLLFDLEDEVNGIEGEALRLSLKELNRLEEEYITLFVGKSFSGNRVYYFDYEPSDGVEAEQQIIGWFSPSVGISYKKPEIRKSDFKPLTIKTETQGKLNVPKIELIDNSQKTPVPIKYGLYYRMPGRVNVSLQYTNRELVKKQMQIAQKGIVLPLPVVYLNNGYAIEFYSETGAIKRISKE